ncbi:MAG: ammonium transporter [Clostridia bacterium]|nr:ammonium transporter [Clostridia bacterium]
MKKRLVVLLVVIILVVIPSVVFGAEDTVESAIDTVWVLIAAFLVFFMQAGFAMVESGFTRAKNASNIIMKNMMDVAIGSLVYFAIGFGIMFGADKFGLFGTTGFFGTGLTAEFLGLNIPLEAFLIFQTVFAATAATIVSGAMAERTKFSSYIIYSFVISIVIYPVVGHWIWGGGWLSNLGMVDFAGSTVVHSVGGWAALVGASILGPRIGKYNKEGKPNAIPGHNITMGALGVFILWFGWFGFNPGSTVSGMDSSIGFIAMTTNLAAAAGGVVTMFLTWIKYKKPDVSMTLNGVLAGLVGITAGCASVSLWGAIAIGAIAGVVVVFGVEFLEKVLKVDDPVGAVAVHGFCGATGTMLVGLFATEGGLFYGGGFELLGIQALGVLAVAAWTLGTSFLLFQTIKKFNGLRVEEHNEVAGLDIGEHGSVAYGDFQMKSLETLGK